MRYYDSTHFFAISRMSNNQCIFMINTPHISYFPGQYNFIYKKTTIKCFHFFKGYVVIQVRFMLIVALWSVIELLMCSMTDKDKLPFTGMSKKSTS